MPKFKKTKTHSRPRSAIPAHYQINHFLEEMRLQQRKQARFGSPTSTSLLVSRVLPLGPPGSPNSSTVARTAVQGPGLLSALPTLEALTWEARD